MAIACSWAYIVQSGSLLRGVSPGCLVDYQPLVLSEIDFIFPSVDYVSSRKVRDQILGG